MFCIVLLELLLPFRPFKQTANIRWTTISAQILHDNKTKWRVARKRKTGGAEAGQLSTRLNKPLTPQRRSHRLIEPYRTIEPKLPKI